MDVSLLESDDLVSIIKAMKNEIKMLKEKNGQQEKHIKNIENDLALAKAAAVAAEETWSAFVAVKNTVSSASNCSELDAGNTEQDGDGVPKPLSQLKVQSDGITTNEDQTINNNNEELANSVVKDKPGNTSVISVCVTSSSHEVSTFFSILIYWMQFIISFFELFLQNVDKLMMLDSGHNITDIQVLDGECSSETRFAFFFSFHLLGCNQILILL